MCCRRTSDKSELHAYAAQSNGAVPEDSGDALPAGKEQVWMSHGDEAHGLPAGFEAVATSEQVSPSLLSECTKSDSSCRIEQLFKPLKPLTGRIA